jgi:DNA-binding transcriptional MerR regulator
MPKDKKITLDDVKEYVRKHGNTPIDLPQGEPFTASLRQGREELRVDFTRKERRIGEESIKKIKNFLDLYNKNNQLRPVDIGNETRASSYIIGLFRAVDSKKNKK